MQIERLAGSEIQRHAGRQPDDLRDEQDVRRAIGCQDERDEAVVGRRLGHREPRRRRGADKTEHDGPRAVRHVIDNSKRDGDYHRAGTGRAHPA